MWSTTTTTSLARMHTRDLHFRLIHQMHDNAGSQYPILFSRRSARRCPTFLNVINRHQPNLHSHNNHNHYHNHTPRLLGSRLLLLVLLDVVACHALGSNYSWKRGRKRPGRQDLAGIVQVRFVRPPWWPLEQNFDFMVLHTRVQIMNWPQCSSSISSQIIGRDQQHSRDQ